MVQRRQHADRRVQRGVAVHQRGRGAQRLADRRAGQAHQPAHRLPQRVEGRAVAIRAVLPEPGHRTQDDVGLQLAQPVVAEAHLFHDAGPEILQHDVGGRHQGGENLLAALGAHVEAQALLAAVVDREIDALAAHHRLRFARLLAAQFLDLDDLGAEVGQDHPAARPRLISRQFQNPDAVECSAHRNAPSARRNARGRAHASQHQEVVIARSNATKQSRMTAMRHEREGNNDGLRIYPERAARRRALITLNRPEKLNALSFPLMEELDGR